jgi:hypothetical protein
LLYLITIVFVDLYSSTSIIVTLFPIFCFIFFAKRNTSLLPILIFSYCLYSLINELARLNGLDSLISIPNKDFYLLSTYTIIEYILLSSYLYILIKKKILKKVLIVFSIIFLIVSLGNLIFIKEIIPGEIDSIPLAISSIILISCSLVYFFETIQTPEISFIYSKPSFWVVVGIMIYFSGTFFLFLQYENLSDTDKKTFWIINMFCLILKNIFFSISFILKPENQHISNVDDYYLNKIE